MLRSRIQAAVVILGTTLSGCVAVDPRAKSETPASNTLTAINARFVNKPSYTSSKFGFIGPPDLGELFGTPMMGSDGHPTIGKYQVEIVELAYTPDKSLKISLVRNGSIVAERQMLFGTDLSVKDNRFYLKRGGCGGADSEQLGCASHTITFFTNGTGDLVVVDAGGGAGLVTVLPFAAYATLMSIFPRVQ